MGEGRRVFIWVQHLLGIGHLMRAAHLARHLAASGWSVEVASGGQPVPDLDLGRARLHQLPPVRAADPAFSALADADGRPLTDKFKSARRDRLLGLFATVGPDILILEHYPFGRRQLRFELEPLLAEAAHRREPPLVVASVRDILVERRAERQAEAAAIVARRFDAVLVHGDPALVPFEASFDRTADIADKLAYTGYVGGTAAGPEPPPGDGAGEIVVSAGGGAVGGRIVEVALAAAAAAPARRWRILVGANANPAPLRDLRAGAPVNASVEAARRDFRGLLARCAASVSQAGYNTVVDVLATGARAVLIPFAAGRETEQSLRARRLAGLGLARVLPEAALSPVRLAEEIAAALAPPAERGKIRLDGEAETARLLERALASRRGGRV